MVRRGLAATLAGAALGLTLANAVAACPAPLDMRILPAEAQPAPHPWPQWSELSQALSRRLARTNLSTVDLVFVGDSLVSGWTPEVFQHFYGHRRALNLGVPGDTTQSLLWRLQRGSWPSGLRPRVAVLLVGTNNAAFGWPAGPTAQAILRVVEEMRARAPGLRVVLVGLLPREAAPGGGGRALIREINHALRSCHDGQTLFWLDAGPWLLDGQQRLSSLVSYDMLHLTSYGYTILSTVLEDVLRRALGEPSAIP